MRHASGRAGFSARFERDLDDCRASLNELANKLSRLFGRLRGFRDISFAEHGDRISALNLMIGPAVEGAVRWSPRGVAAARRRPAQW